MVYKVSSFFNICFIISGWGSLIFPIGLFVTIFKEKTRKENKKKALILSLFRLYKRKYKIFFKKNQRVVQIKLID